MVSMVQSKEAEITFPTFACLRCCYIWSPRKPEKPRRCAKCKTPYWDLPRKKKKGKGKRK